jgi:hypothetical protein
MGRNHSPEEVRVSSEGVPLDEATRRFFFLLQRDLRRLAEVEQVYASRGEQLRYDSVSRLAVFESPRGDVTARLYGEVLATYSTEDRILRWAWAGRAPSASPTHGDAVFRAGQARGIAQLAMSLVGDLDPEEAASVARLGALVARAEALHVRTTDREIEYVGLFERPRPSDEPRVAKGSHYSVPPPPAAPARSASAPPPRAYASLPPIREIWEPRTSGGGRSDDDEPSPARRAHDSGSRPRSAPPPARASAPPPAPAAPREPAREDFLPVANGALAALATKCAGYKQGLLVVTIDDAVHEKRRFVVQLVVLDEHGVLRALDPPSELVEAAARMIEADRRRAGAAWRKLSARITPKPDGGATLVVDMT